MPGCPLLDPKNDIVFKMQFAENKDILIDLINAIRNTEPPVVALEVLNSEITPEEVRGKLVRLDILAQDASGQMFDIEMQTTRHAGWSARSVFYLARMLSQQLKEGESYRRVRPVVGVHLVNFNVFSEPEQALWTFELRDGKRPDVVLDRSLQLNIVELPKADRLHACIHPVLAQWVAYFQHWQEEHVMQQIEHPPIQQAYQRLHEISADRKAQFQALAREMALHDEATLREERDEPPRESRRLQPLREWSHEQTDIEQIFP